MFEPVNICRIANSELNSNTYIIWCEDCCWLIDPGDINPITNFCEQNNILPQGMLLTHYHFDHIYGVNNVRRIYGQELPVYCGAKTKEGLLNARLNQSIYTGNPFVIDEIALRIIEDQSNIVLWNNIIAKAIYTPGHNDDCFSYIVDKMLFTGDALIPHIKVHTRSKKADKILAQQTVDKLLRDFDGDFTIYPGHNEPCTIKELR